MENELTKFRFDAILASTGKEENESVPNKVQHSWSDVQTHSILFLKVNLWSFLFCFIFYFFNYFYFSILYFFDIFYFNSYGLKF